MRFQETCATLLGFMSLASSAPSDETPQTRGLKWRSRNMRRAPLIVQQNVQETNIIVVNNNQAELDALQTLAEQQFAALVQSEVALVSQLQTVKDNIRVNHFKARFAQANTVIVTVTTMIDARAGQNSAQRYLVNQLLADNGKPDAVATVMVSDVATMTIGAAQTLVQDGVTASAAVPAATAALQAADPAAPFGQVNQTMIMQAGAVAPTNDVVFADPAAIILPDQTNLFVESTDTFLQDCGFYQDNGQTFINLGTETLTSFQQVAGADGTISIIQQQQVNVVAPVAR
ncbi:hypothetical protein F5Y15DRAFT_256907 [Xylariaceae sp. FL0016]|nr:hypothetical protein F5Y15DRAFT_256907 [Xylariaceae sp. FL0016]